jgi:hypothetical protein
VIAVLEGTRGPLVEGRPYHDEAFIAQLEEYHEAAVEAHKAHAPLTAPLPRLAPEQDVVRGEVVDGTPPALPDAPAADAPPSGLPVADAPSSDGPATDGPDRRPGGQPAADEPAAKDRRPPTE